MTFNELGRFLLDSINTNYIFVTDWIYYNYCILFNSLNFIFKIKGSSCPSYLSLGDLHIFGGPFFIISSLIIFVTIIKLLGFSLEVIANIIDNIIDNIKKKLKALLRFFAETFKINKK